MIYDENNFDVAFVLCYLFYGSCLADSDSALFICSGSYFQDADIHKLVAINPHWFPWKVILSFLTNERDWD